MHVPFLDMAAQFDSLKAELLPVIEQTLAKGHYVLGPNVAAFEQEIAALVGTRFAIGVNSGSDALTLALRALDIGPGDEVITTPFTYIAPAESIHQLGARIVFADIDPRTFLLDTREVEQKRPRVDVRKDDARAQLVNRLGGGDISEGRGDDFVARPNVQRPKR